MNLHTHKHTAGVQHKLIGFADTELQEIVFAYCNESLYSCISAEVLSV